MALFIFVVGDFIIAFLLTLYFFYLSYSRLDEFEDSLKTSRLVVYNKNYLGDSGLARIYRMGQVSYLCAFHDFAIRQGQLDAEEASRLPSRLTRLVVWPTRLLLVCGALIVLLGGYGTYLGGFKQ
ncbi:hypothetical protein [Pseudomonas sp. RIT-PI-AD]|uniref:hypothetical protein n=1 Tax=Pseudomonas sp. RIT-PI-AD TaxID=3035294 RepID=UPI0021D7E55C|nr:hypothetical protein [Pseudomonas sp. RIT-PI-AD]